MTRSIRVDCHPLRTAVSLAGLLTSLSALGDTAVRVSDINPGPGNSGPIFPMTVFGGKLYFPAFEPTFGQELYVYDGVSMPSIVADIRPGSLDSQPRDLVVFNGQLHFVAADAAGVRQIWRSDGTNPPVVAVSLGSASDPVKLKVFGSLLVFQASSTAAGEELWKWDGANPIVQVADIRSGAQGSLSNDGFAVLGSQLLFRANDGSGAGAELWKWNGVSAPSSLGDLVPGPASSVVDFEQDFVVLNGVAFFSNTDPAGSGQAVLWKWDGSGSPTTIGNFDMEGGMGLYAGFVYFTALNLDPGNPTANEIWRYDGVNPPVQIAPDLGWSITQDFTEFNGFLYFIHSDTGAEVYKYDGVNPPVVDADPWTGPSEGPGRGFEPFGGFLYLVAGTAANGAELWKITAGGGGGPTPTVTSVAPTSGPSSGGTAIQIEGSDFVAGATVRIAAAYAADVVVTDSTTIHATTPAVSPGVLHDVTVTNPPAQSGTLPAGFFADFLDVPQGDIFHDFVVKIFLHGVTAGCGGGNYCRNNPVTRAQMAVFLLKAGLGSAYLPPACTGEVFDDVPCTGGPFDPWIEDLAGRGITAGCGGGNYCPGNPVTRGQMAPFLLRSLLGSVYTPPPCTGTVFDDVPCAGGPFDPWIEDLASRDITGGCDDSPPLYCPTAPNTRGQMAVFLVKTFDLP